MNADQSYSELITYLRNLRLSAAKFPLPSLRLGVSAVE